jgi:diaminopimelate epimerase
LSADVRIDRPHLTLIKTHAYGNDFLLAVGPVGESDEGSSSAIARRVCHRHTGIGADGLIEVSPAPGGARMVLYNPDGTRPEISGNGVRCLGAWLVLSRGLASGAEVVIDTDAGPRPLRVLGIQGTRVTFRAWMGHPEDVRQVTLDVDGDQVTVVAMRVGNPQCVVLGPATEERLVRIASRLAVHPYFAKGTNVSLAEVPDPGRVRILIWERGVGPTMSSGTGTCGAAVAAASFGGALRHLTVDAPGGSQVVEWTNDGLWLTGWAEVVAEVAWWPS